MEDRRLSRRGFLKAGVAAGALLGAGTAAAQSPVGEYGAPPADPPGAPPAPAAGAQEPRPVPRRTLGRSGVKVPILSLGGMFDTRSAQLLLRRTLDWGVAYWDTADCYENGHSEEGLGRYFQRNPADRARVFLATKSDARDPDEIEKLLARSLSRLATDHLDLYLLHGIRGPDQLNNALEGWVRKAKESGRIRAFGFSTHANVETCLEAAARLPYVDAVMCAVNHRRLSEPRMKAALAAASGAGVGLVAMKFQGGGPVPVDGDAAGRLASRLAPSGLTPEQAMLKALWAEPAIATVCAAIKTFQTLQEYAAAALDPRPLSARDRRALQAWADETAGTYCAACGACEEATGGAPVAEAMRCLMYSAAYGDGARGREAFGALPAADRERLARCDAGAARRACPRGLPVDDLLAEALRRWG